MIAATGTYAVPYDVRARFALVDLDDVAQAAARVPSQNSRHVGAIYELAGPENLSSTEIAEQLTDSFAATGRGGANALGAVE